MTSESLKTLGNQAFAAGNYTDAIEHFSAAIAVDPENHVLYSNRSAAYSSLKDYKSAAADAEKTVSIKPDWAKGFSRKGAALHGLGNMEGACEAYKQGLKIDPENALLKKGLEDVESAMESDALGGIGNVFGPDMWAKLAANPKVSHLLAQPDLVQKLQDIQKNPKNMGMYMQDQRIMQIMMSLMGLDAQMASTPEELEKATEQAHENLEKSKSETKHVPEPVVEEQISPEEKAKKTKREASDNEKQLGNEFYKKRKFEDALTHYDAAWNLDETNVAVLTNKAAVLFEMENYTECIAVSEKAVETARDLRADYKLIGRALGRIGTAYTKLGDLEKAIKYYEKSLTEHRTPDILNKLRETEAAKKQKDIADYTNPALADEAREKGNDLFKEHKFADAVKFYAEAIKRNPSDPRNYSNRAASLAKLMALPEAEKDCDQAIKLDKNFVKAYVRKAAIQFTKREYTKCIETCTLAMDMDLEKKHTAELQGQIQRAYHALGQANNEGTNEEKYARAMQDPEVQKIMGDPVMQTILKQMQEDPRAAQDHMKNPGIAAKIRVLVNAGIIQTR